MGHLEIVLPVTEPAVYGREQPEYGIRSPPIGSWSWQAPPTVSAGLGSLALPVQPQLPHEDSITRFDSQPPFPSLQVPNVSKQSPYMTPIVGQDGKPNPKQPKSCVGRALRYSRRLVKIVCLGLMLLVVLISTIGWPREVTDDEGIHSNIMSVLFLVGLFLVAVEDIVEINKSAVMLILAATMWVFTAAAYHPLTSKAGHERFHHELDKGLEDVGSIVLFLLPAMSVVESIDHFDGFAVVTVFITRIVGDHRERLMPITCLFAFFMSSVIDNLTATIVAVKILRHVAKDDQEWRCLCGGLAVLAANAGGAWSPIGDVTTTMLWLQGKITVTKTVLGLFMPSLVAAIVPLIGLWMQALWTKTVHEKTGAADTESVTWSDSNVSNAGPSYEHVTKTSVFVLLLGITCILLVPVLKMWTGLPPYLGMLLALGVVWVTTDMMHLGGVGHGSRDAVASQNLEAAAGAALTESEAGDADGRAEQKSWQPHPEHVPGQGGVPAALHKVDLTGLLFFAGVLLAVVALDSAGVLTDYAKLLVKVLGEKPPVLCFFLGISSGLVDNVPLVEAAIEMFGETPVDDPLWQLVALAAGTGGSILSIGSIAGVTLMGMEGVGFLWYLQKVSLWAFIGFALGIATYQMQEVMLDFVMGTPVP